MKRFKHNLNVVISSSILLVYLLIICVISFIYNVEAGLLGVRVKLVLVLFIMSVLEFLSTISFQLRIYLTGKEKFKLAALIGASSWLIAGFEGLLLINGDVYFGDYHPDWASFLIKIPPVFIATYNGIYLNSIVYKRKVKNV